MFSNYFMKKILRSRLTSLILLLTTLILVNVVIFMTMEQSRKDMAAEVKLEKGRDIIRSKNEQLAIFEGNFCDSIEACEDLVAKKRLMQAVAEVSFCEVDDDCIVVTKKCAFDCGVTINKFHRETILREHRIFEEGLYGVCEDVQCPLETYLSPVFCKENKCVQEVWIPI